MDVNVLFIRHYRLHIFNELKLPSPQRVTAVNRDKRAVMTFSNLLQLLLKDLTVFQNSKHHSLEVCLRLCANEKQ